MAITVTCQCGKSYAAKDELAGRQLKCPACGQILVVPQPASPDTRLDLGDLGGLDLGAPGAVDPLGTGPTFPSATEAGAGTPAAYGTRHKPLEKTSVWLIVAMSVGGGVAALTLLFLLFAVIFGGGDELESGVGEVASADIGQEAETSNNASAESTPVVRSSASASGSTTAAPRRYASFPDAVSSAPEFLLADAPFDVPTFFESPPPDQNASPLYLDALFEFGTDLETCFPEAERQKRRVIVVQRQKRSYDIQLRRGQNESSVSNRELDAALQDLAVGFQKLDVAQQRPRCLFETGIGLALMRRLHAKWLAGPTSRRNVTWRKGDGTTRKRTSRECCI